MPEDLPPIGLERARPLAPLTSWRVGGPAAYFAEPSDPEALRSCLRFAESQRLPVLPLGGGTNLLIADEGFAGLVIRYADDSRALRRLGDSATLRLGARHALARAARESSGQGWAGIEWAEGIPGTVGGAVVGNAGAYGGDTASVVLRVETFTLSSGIEILPGADCRFGYRSSRFRSADPDSEPVFILAADLGLREEDPAVLRARMQEIAAQRKSRTPAGLSCGSVFRNPPGESAGRLIEQAGLKGETEGPAIVSSLHANYIVNRGGATSADIRRLIDRVRERVRAESGIELELEVRLVGFGSAL